MSRKQKIFFTIAGTLVALGLIVVAVTKANRLKTHFLGEAATFAGSVMAQNDDTTRQTPLAGVRVTAMAGSRAAETQTNSSGYFSLTLQSGIKQGEAVTLSFANPNYKPLQMTVTAPPNQLYLARMEPLQAQPRSRPKGGGSPGQMMEIRNIRVRYSFKDESTVGVGSLAKQFSAPNQGNVPCHGQNQCSPDGRWQATSTTLSLDAGEGNEFRNVRVSCIAGPCAFTAIDPDHFSPAERKIRISVLNWSDTADFLVEADVSRTMVADSVRISYPFIVGETMNFSLPPTSEGPSVEADLDGQHIVFPLGPTLNLSWSNCSVETSPSGDKIYRCQTKPGYRLQG